MREVETGQAVGAPPPEACGSPARPADPGRQTDLQHPRGRLQEQREPHRGQSSAAPLRSRPGRHDAAAVPDGEAQPAAESEPLLAPVLLVSAPGRDTAVIAPSAARAFRERVWTLPMLSCSLLHPGKAEHDWARKWGAEVGRGSGDLVAAVQGLLALLPAAPPEPESRRPEGCPGGITAQWENALNTPPLLLLASAELIRNSQV